jgi:putative flavoprotein involved in K+ transport
VLERGRIGQTWHDRWDRFCLVTPNWTVQLPGGHYDGDDPDGFMSRDEIVAFLERYAAGFEAPVREGVEVASLTPASGGGFLLATSDGELRVPQVVVATGSYRQSHRPAVDGLPADLLQLDVDGYTNEGELTAGKVLVVGSGQSGCQLAEELHEAGRDVSLSCGRAPWWFRRVGGRDLMWWALETGFLDATTDTLPFPEARLFANILATGARRRTRPAEYLTFGRFALRVSSSSATSSVSRGRVLASHPTSARASPGVTSATASSRAS